VYLISKPPPVETEMEEESGGDSPESLPARADKLEFRLNLVEDGTIVRAYYDYAVDNAATPAPVMVSMVSKDGWLELLLNAGEEDMLIKRVRIPAIEPASPDAEEFDLTISGKEGSENRGFPVVSLSITTYTNQLCADISFEENAEIQTEPVALVYPVGGTASFYLGSGDATSVTAVISDMGVLFNRPAKPHTQQAVAVQKAAPQKAESPRPPPPSEDAQWKNGVRDIIGDYITHDRIPPLGDAPFTVYSPQAGKPAAHRDG
jgi:hypothetical protein